MEFVNVKDFEAPARARIEAGHWDYYMGGSDDEVTLHANRTAFERLALRPRMLIDVSSCQLQTNVLDTPLSMPILVAPMAFHGFAHPAGECETARGVGKADTLLMVPTVSHRTIEEVAEAASGPLWLQLYVYDDPVITANLVRRAEQAGYRAIVLTVDIPRFGRREKDLRNQLRVPAAANFSVDDVTKMKSSLSWQDLEWLRSLTSLPLLIKGILTAEDARLAVEYGAHGIIVSNHGGRQLDTAIASIDALPEVVEAVAGRCDVYVDGGIRRGTDVIKALALGARAVLLGRPVLWGLAVDGANGVYQILELLRAELELGMALCGRPTLESIDRSLVKAV